MTFLILIVITSFSSIIAQTQTPSPMVEFSRTHNRVKMQNFSGCTFQIENIILNPIHVAITNKNIGCDSLSIMIHFHGSSHVPIYAVEESKKQFALATINLGYGSSAYEKPFKNTEIFLKIIKAISDSVYSQPNRKFKKIYLTAFSAGYGAIRAILNDPILSKKIDGVILLDGLHTDYIPEGKVLADGGILNTEKLICFLDFAKLAVNGDQKFIITHSEIFPGKYASTTETADYLIKETKSNRQSVLKWGALGMQQTSEVINGNFIVLGFAGNSAPDHIDHFHALFDLMKYLD